MIRFIHNLTKLIYAELIESYTHAILSLSMCYPDELSSNWSLKVNAGWINESNVHEASEQCEIATFPQYYKYKHLPISWKRSMLVWWGQIKDTNKDSYLKLLKMED